ncbi:hypothetical protein HDU96_009893 [Phlyctochytrium bullatum]|nr:hypothetical protein HDU96_009893 [Phlyctochytrium bullatum]
MPELPVAGAAAGRKRTRNEAEETTPTTDHAMSTDFPSPRLPLFTATSPTVSPSSVAAFPTKRTAAFTRTHVTGSLDPNTVIPRPAGPTEGFPSTRASPWCIPSYVVPGVPPSSPAPAVKDAMMA